MKWKPVLRPTIEEIVEIEHALRKLAREMAEAEDGPDDVPGDAAVLRQVAPHCTKAAEEMAQGRASLEEKLARVMRTRAARRPAEGGLHEGEQASPDSRKRVKRRAPGGTGASSGRKDGRTAGRKSKGLRGGAP